MDFRLLGAVEVWTGGRRLEVGPQQRRTTLAILLVEAGRLVSLDAMVDRVWGDAPPGGARQSLYAHIARIRRLLDPARLVSRSGGYLLEVDPELVDLHRFRRLLDAARRPGLADPERVRLLSEALGSWRGDPLAGLAGDWAARIRQGCRRQRLDATLVWADAQLRMGDPGAVVGVLADLSGEHPMVEPLTAALMRALHASGRTAEALACYARTRRTLAEELGTDPGIELTELHQALLRGHGTPRDRVAVRPRSVPPSPAQLPLDAPGFAGRAAELAQLDEGLAAMALQPTAVVIMMLVGSAGVGKTALAVHWAHRVADRFPDGQLFVNLRGFDAGGPAMSAVEAVRGFLDAFGLPPQRIPMHLHAQTALYRSLLQDRRMLVVLDNARDVEQVRPLLPGSPGCLVVVTSRGSLTSLIAAECARPVAVDVLSVPDARQLLAGRLGESRLTAEPSAVREIVNRCARLPLALAVVAARAATRRSLPLDAVAGELRDARHRLDVLTSGEDAATDVRAAFSWSYRQLSPPAARLFRLLALHTGPSIAAGAAASLAGDSVPSVRPLLTELVRAHLVAEEVPDRYAFHDLLRAYAGELAESGEPDADRRGALHRVLDHYLHTAHTADRLLYPHRDEIALPPHGPGVTPEALPDDRSATAWFTAEYPNLMATIRAAAEAGLDAYAWRLAWLLITFQDRQGRWQDVVATQQSALDAAVRLDDRHRQAFVQRDLGFALARLGRYEEACLRYRQAVELFGEFADQTGQARAHRDLAFVAWRRGRDAEALVHIERALRLSRTAGHRAGRAYALNAVGMYHYLRRDLPRAVESMDQAVPLYQEIGDRVGEAVAWECLGHTHHRLGDHRAADACYQKSLDLRRALGDRYLEADTLRHQGRNHLAATDRDGARRAWQRALAILDELGHPDADEVRADLARAAVDPDPRLPGVWSGNKDSTR